MSYWNKIYKLTFVLICVIVLIVVICIFVPSFNKLNELHSKKAELQQENRMTEEMTKELRDKQERFSTDPRFIERTAREAGMVKTTETVFKFTNKQTETSGRIPE